jgi:CRP-like cAMP-binding protein
MSRKLVGIAQSAGGGHLLSDELGPLFSNAQNGGFEQGTVQTYPAQAVIFHQDTQPHAVYLIERGMVKLVRVAESGQSIIVGVRRQHWMIGAPSVLLGKLYSFTAITMARSALRCIPAKDFVYLAKTNEQFSWDLHRLLAQQIVTQMKNVEAISCLPARDRLKRFLRDMIDEQNPAASEPSSFTVSLTSKELTQILAITPEHLCRVLKELKQQGLISHAKGVLTVNDPASLL